MEIEDWGSAAGWGCLSEKGLRVGLRKEVSLSRRSAYAAFPSLHSFAKLQRSEEAYQAPSRTM